METQVYTPQSLELQPLRPEQPRAARKGLRKSYSAALALSPREHPSCRDLFIPSAGGLCDNLKRAQEGKNPTTVFIREIRCLSQPLRALRGSKFCNSRKRSNCKCLRMKELTVTSCMVKVTADKKGLNQTVCLN